ncbi:hypothetical protein ACJRO7_004728 [Eucalyptus globulus]|uniref:Uncharacterized protein n=1 Tax=Eucalyptus globulus TaxID=34317 RepID=A0ABD3IXL2_EUCGL
MFAAFKSYSRHCTKQRLSPQEAKLIMDSRRSRSFHVSSSLSESQSKSDTACFHVSLSSSRYVRQPPRGIKLQGTADQVLFVNTVIVKSLI